MTGKLFSFQTRKVTLCDNNHRDAFPTSDFFVPDDKVATRLVFFLLL